MGPLGTEGTFTKAAEATLEVLKDNSYALLTILSAIVADPLYKWSISSHQNQRKNNDLKSSRKSVVSKKVIQESFSSSEENDTVKKNEAAAHTIRKIHEKLQGYEDGTSEQQSVVGQISLLINSARDRDNLCSMFPGWAPWV